MYWVWASLFFFGGMLYLAQAVITSSAREIHILVAALNFLGVIAVAAVYLRYQRAK
jgi:hypothetical protein